MKNWNRITCALAGVVALISVSSHASLASEQIDQMSEVESFSSCDCAGGLDRNRPEHVSTWYALFNLKLVDSAFARSGGIRIAELMNGVDENIDRVVLARYLDQIFRKLDRAQIRPGVSDPERLIVRALENDDENLVWFANEMGKIYQF